MPVGYLVTTVVLSAVLVIAARPPMPDHTSSSSLWFLLGFLVNEVPHLPAAVLVASTALAGAEGDLGHPVGLAGLVCAAVGLVAAVVIGRRALRARAVLAEALTPDDAGGTSMPGRHPWLRIALAPLPLPTGLVQVRDVAYGPHGQATTLDLYRHPDRTGGPVLVYLHGGGFRSGHKRREGKPLFHGLARRGWVTISADYRLLPEARHPDPLVDVKRVIAWTRAHAAEHGGDPDRIFLAGASAGGHLATAAALSANRADLQPGFGDVDTSLAGVIPLYAYYGAPAAHPGVDSSIAGYIDRAERDGHRPPPFLVIHGELDTVVVVSDARRTVDRLRSVSDRPVRYAELPGAQHGFDVLRSARSEAVVDAVETFAATTAHRHPA